MNKGNFRVFLLAFFFLWNILPLYGQNNNIESKKETLEEKKEENLRRIREAQETLKETTSKKQNNIGELNALNEQISARNELMQSINQEIELLESEITEVNQVISGLENDLKELRDEYIDMLFVARKTNMGIQTLTFLFSAQSFNQFFMRLQYLQQYTEVRKNQVEQIKKVKATLSHQKNAIEEKKKEKQALLEEKMQENKNLIALKKEHRAVISNLNQQENEIKDELKQRRKAVNRLDRMIANLVNEEMNKSSADNEENEMISSSFEENKNNLTWPVNSGFISRKFGVNPHPVFNNIKEENNGVDIQTKKSANVRVVSNGKVVKVASVPGMNKVVLVKHGDYYTLYARLKEVIVEPGQTLQSREIIGEVYTNENDISAVHFEIWHNNQKLNPQNWLTKR